MNKRFFDTYEIIKYLYENKKVIVANDEKRFFEERNYISIINPYKELFSYGKDKDNKHIYKKYIQFDRYLDLIKYDEQISTELFKYISCFEKEFKNVVFDVICKKYTKRENPDMSCIEYINDIKLFNIKYILLTPLMRITNYNAFLPKPPIFCQNFYYKIVAKKGYVKDRELLNKKLSVLNKLMNIGNGKEKSRNLLVSHYSKEYKKVPLWIVPNALSLGEILIAFSLLDNESQTTIASRFLNEDACKINVIKLSKFSAILEQVRVLRNTINHYEPLFPLFFNIKNKKIDDSQLIVTIKFLKNNYILSNYTNYHIQGELCNINSHDSRKMNILNEIFNIINK